MKRSLLSLALVLALCLGLTCPAFAVAKNNATVKYSAADTADTTGDADKTEDADTADTTGDADKTEDADTADTTGDTDKTEDADTAGDADADKTEDADKADDADADKTEDADKADDADADKTEDADKADDADADKTEDADKADDADADKTEDADKADDADADTTEDTDKADEPAETVIPFTDVKEGSYYYKAVQWAVAQKIANGKTTTTFCPADTCTQGEILAFIYRFAGREEPTIENPYTNAAVKAGSYCYKPMLWAYEKGIVTDTALDPTAPCTRSDVVTYLWRNAGKPEAEATAAFTDVAADAAYAQAVAWADATNVTHGTTATTFEPDGICSRGQIVTFLYRAANITPATPAEPADGETTAPETTPAEDTEGETTAPETDATEGVTQAPETEATEGETTAPETDATEGETTAPETETETEA